MTEKDTQSLIQIALSRLPDVRTFRNNQGVGWQGTVLSHRAGVITLGNARPLHAGLFVGSSDLLGWKSIIITPAMVSSKVALFTSIEVKSAIGKLRPEQVIWLDAVHAAGGIADVVRSPEEAIAALK